ncbi:MAG: M48 family metallopeptidase, partial [Deltaproteobacteria bacterium]|nr:M48 family metallopeptidase [Deltaproteobacteria bacterium]
QGNWYPLRLASHKGPPRICLEAGELRLYAEGNGTLLPPENDELKELVYAGYRPLAATLIEQRVFMLAGETGLQPARVRIREQKRRWGSCSAKKWLNLNWRLALAPPEVMDYVILHELCHLEHLNHSPRFWSRVGYFMPDYGRHRRWLRENGSELFL